MQCEGKISLACAEVDGADTFSFAQRRNLGEEMIDDFSKALDLP